MERMSMLMIIGVVLVLGGLLGFAVPVFTIQSMETVAKVGDLKLLTTENTSHRVPQILSGSALVLGLVFVGLSLKQKH